MAFARFYISDFTARPLHNIWERQHNRFGRRICMVIGKDEERRRKRKVKAKLKVKREK
jgi:hypothetical protein